MEPLFKTQEERDQFRREAAEKARRGLCGMTACALTVLNVSDEELVHFMKTGEFVASREQYEEFQRKLESAIT